jgi:hypothetical protein
MKNYLVVIIVVVGLTTILSNCGQPKDNKESGDAEIKFLDNTFKATLDTFIEKTNKEPAYNYDEILIKLYKKQNSLDTLMLIDNSPITEKNNFVFSSRYKNYRIHFYSTEEYKNKLYQLVDTSNIIKEFPKEAIQDIDISYQMLYKLTNDTIIRQQIPIDIN